MLAANIWHWWIGVILTLASVLGVVAVIGGYLKQVSAQRYPGKRNRRED
jgi:CHASE2 domain-containing sensor protein